MAIQNIQSLFSMITVEQVTAYLTQKGWTQHVNGGRLDFTKASENGTEVQRVFIPAQQSHPKFRSLLPNVVFTLSVLEQREAIEIANQINDTVIAAVTSQLPGSQLAGPQLAGSQSIGAQSSNQHSSGGSQSNSPATQRLVLYNTSASAGQLQIVHSKNYSLQPFEQAHVLLQVGTAPTRIAFTGDIQLDAGPNASAKVLLGLPQDFDAKKKNWLKPWLTSRLHSLSTLAQSPEESIDSQQLEAIERLVAQFEFAVEEDKSGPVDAGTLLRPSAVLLCNLIQRLSKNQSALQFLVDLTRRLAALASLTLTLEWSDGGALWETGLADDPLAPAQTLAWLRSNLHKLD